MPKLSAHVTVMEKTPLHMCTSEPTYSWKDKLKKDKRFLKKKFIKEQLALILLAASWFIM